jgi:hypothetical protein
MVENMPSKPLPPPGEQGKYQPMSHEGESLTREKLKRGKRERKGRERNEEIELKNKSKRKK